MCPKVPKGPLTWRYPNCYIDNGFTMCGAVSGGVRMANNKVTKEALAKGFKELLKERAFEKISVKDIAEQCGMNRNSFYYHFQDKYELMNWIFDTEVASQKIIFDGSSKFLIDSFKNVCCGLYNDRDFYLACFKYEGQNSLYEALNKLYFGLWKERLGERYKSLNIELDEEELDLMAKINTRAVVGTLKDWIKGGLHDNYMDYYEKNFSALDDKECFMVGGKYIMLS